MTGKSIK